MSEMVPGNAESEITQANSEKRPSRHLLRRWACGVMSAMLFGYIFDATVISELLVPEEAPKVEGPTPKQLACKDAKGVGITKAGTGLPAENYMRDVMAPTFNAAGLCLAALHEGRTSRGDADGRAIGEYALSLNLAKPVELFLFADSESGINIPAQIKAIREVAGTRARVAAVTFNASPDNKSNVMKPDGRWYVDHHDFPYAKGVVFASNWYSELMEGKDMSDWRYTWYAWDNMTQTSVPKTKSQLKNIFDGFPEVATGDLKNADGTFPDFEYLYVTTDDTVDAPAAARGIQAKLHVPMKIRVIETDVPFMHAKEWLTDKYPVYEPYVRARVEEISAAIDHKAAA